MKVEEYFNSNFDCDECKFSEFCKRYLLGTHYSACDYDPPLCSLVNEDDMFKDVDIYYNELLQTQLYYESKKEQQRKRKKKN